jgi:putative acetyltransferase
VWYESAQVAHPFWERQMFDREREAIAEQHLPRAETYVYERTGTVVGFISLLGTEVGGLFVTPRHHREGIGRALMDEARGTREHLELDVFEANVIGRAFYERYGFRTVGERLDEATGFRVLRLELGPFSEL